MANALVVIDVQRYFLASAPQDLPQRIVKHYQSTTYDHIIFTVFRNEPGSNFETLMKWDQCSTDDDVALPAEFDEFVTNENVFTRPFYSAFAGTSLHDYLQQRGIDRIVFCGADTDACVLATAFAAFDLGYHIKIDFNLTHSSNNLQDAAERIALRTLFSRD